MAKYKTKVHIIATNFSTGADSVATSHAGILNDYLETLDSTNNPVLKMNSVVLGNNLVTLIWSTVP